MSQKERDKGKGKSRLSPPSIEPKRRHLGSEDRSESPGVVSLVNPGEPSTSTAVLRESPSLSPPRQPFELPTAKVIQPPRYHPDSRPLQSTREARTLAVEVNSLHERLQPYRNGQKEWDEAYWNSLRQMLERYARAVTHPTPRQDDKIIQSRLQHLYDYPARHGCIVIASLQDLLDHWDSFINVFSSGLVYFDLEG